MTNTQNNLRALPGVDIVLNREDICKLSQRYSLDIITHSVRTEIEQTRINILNGNDPITTEALISNIISMVTKITKNNLKPVINATGIILHTNLGRAPLGEAVLSDIQDILTGYSNLEFNLEKGDRGNRNSHLADLLKYITGAEDAVIVNNNAACVLLCLNTLAQGKEVIVSRGELVEIGGSFRIPDIMAASGTKMVEVGTTNRTRLSDYENAVTEDTAMIFKAHKSNYAVKGFTEEAEVKELARLAETKGIPFVYDLGSGLIRKPEKLSLDTEPDVRQSIKDGADIVTFSCDKLLGGPQAGIIAGKKKYVSRIAKAPMMRALRVGKITIAALSSVVKYYFEDSQFKKNVPIFNMLNGTPESLKAKAEKIQTKLAECGIESRVMENTGFCGGGTLPETEIVSFAVKLIPPVNEKKQAFAERVYKSLLGLDKPVAGILRKGEILLDVMTVFEKDVPYLIASLKEVVLK